MLKHLLYRLALKPAYISSQRISLAFLAASWSIFGYKPICSGTWYSKQYSNWYRPRSDSGIQPARRRLPVTGLQIWTIHHGEKEGPRIVGSYSGEGQHF